MVNTSSDEGSVDLMSSGNVENTPLVISYIYIYMFLFNSYMFVIYFIYYFRSRATPRRVKTWVCPWRPPWSGTPVLRMAALPPLLFVLIGRAGCNQWDQSGPIVTSEISRDQLGLIGNNWKQLGPIETSLDFSYKLEGPDVGPSSKNRSEFVGVWEVDVGL